MAAHIGLDLNDEGVLVVADAAVSPPVCQMVDGDAKRSPGYVARIDRRWEYGIKARTVARKNPNLCATGFWGALHRADERVLPNEPITNAQACYGHLKHILAAVSHDGNAGAAFCLAVPSTLPGPARALLAEMAAGLKLPLRGVIDAALALLVARPATLPRDGESILVLDLTESATIVTEVVRQGQEVSVGRVISSGELGFSELRTQLLHWVDRLFVDAHSFKPRLKGESEQALFDALDPMLDGFMFSEQLPVAVAGRTVHVSRADAGGALSAFHERLADLLAPLVAARRGLQAPPVHVTARAARVPGLVECLRHLHGFDIHLSSEGEIARGALIWGMAVATAGTDPAVTPPSDRVTVGSWAGDRAERADFEAIPLATVKNAPEVGPDAVGHFHTGVGGFLEQGSDPTHVLFQGHVLPLAPVYLIGRDVTPDQGGLSIRHPLDEIDDLHCAVLRAPDGAVFLEDRGRSGVWVNRERIRGQVRVKAGDVIALGGHRVRLMVVRVAGTSSDGNGSA